MQKVRVEEAVGMVLGHDLTKIVPGRSKGPAYKKGHIIQSEDIPRLLDMGKEHLYVLDLGRDLVHEDEAAQRIARAAVGEREPITQGPAGGQARFIMSPPSEGKVNITAAQRGLLQVRPELVEAINCIDDVVLATLGNHSPVEAGELVAGSRIIPLAIPKAAMEKVEAICAQAGPVLDLMPYRSHRVGIVTTGNEVFTGRIQDGFGPAVRKKLAQYPAEVLGQEIVPDDAQRIREAIFSFKEQGATLILVTGGMSVDPDDVTPSAIRSTGAAIITYGVPVLPGAMLLVAYLEGMPLVGVPGCVMYDKTTAFDLVLPRLFAGQKIAKTDLIKLGYRGLCRRCQVCVWPRCSFGQGGA